MALAARERAYSPYSGFRVGSAVLARTGSLYVGSNVENASYGLSICAERAAIFAMAAAGEREIVAIAVATGAEKPTAPCGACRQVIREFARPEALVLVVTAAGARGQHRLSDLLPLDFGPRDLGHAEPSR